MKTSKISLLAAALLVAGASACTLKGSIASFPGYEKPVLLGPTDRIGGGKPMMCEKVGEFEEEVEFEVVQYTEDHGYAKYSVTEETSSSPFKLASAARTSTEAKSDVDIRVTDLMPAGYVAFFGTKAKTYVSVEGDTMRVKGIER